MQFCCIDILHLIRQLVIAANKKPLYIAKYLQFRVFARGKFEGMGGAWERWMEEAVDRVGYEVVEKVDSEGLINSIEWNLYNKVYDDANPL